MVINISSSTSNHPNSSMWYEPDYSVIPELVPFSVAIVLANGLVFFLFIKKKSLRTAANYLLLSLAMCDFFTGIVNIPLIIVTFVQIIPYPKASDLMFLVSVLHSFTAVATGYHILVITVERYLCLVWKVRRPASKNTILKVLGGVWATSAIIAIVPFFWKSDLRQNYDKASTLQTSHAVFCLAAVFLLPYTFIIYAYTVMFKAIVRAKKQRNLEQKSEDGMAENIKRDRRSNMEWRCLVIFVTMAILYLVCWLPWFTLTLILASDLSVDLGEYETVSHVVVVFRYLTSLINPVLYTFFRKDFYLAFKEIFTRRRRDGNVSLSVLATARKSSYDDE